MPYSSNTKNMFIPLDNILRRSDQITREANGGNSVLFSYPPEKEHEFISAAHKHYIEGGVMYGERDRIQAEFVDISKLLINYIDIDGWKDFSQFYQDMSPNNHVAFKSDSKDSSYDDEDNVDFFNMIVEAISDVVSRNKIPILIRTGCLIGTGIENVNIMEHKKIMALKYPLILFYPSKVVDDTLYFLNFKPASKYRCSLVQARG